MSEKPPAVDRYEFWTEPPDVPSPRLGYWLERIADGWEPNGRIRTLGYDGSAEFYGVYLWEWLHVLSPVLSGHTIDEDPWEIIEWLRWKRQRSDLIPFVVAVPASRVGQEVGWVDLPYDEWVALCPSS